jgi:hypothetical protein
MDNSCLVPLHFKIPQEPHLVHNVARSDMPFGDDAAYQFTDRSEVQVSVGLSL